MGFLLDERGDPKGWISCLLCGFAAMGEDELEERQDRKKQLEREARWTAKKTQTTGEAQEDASDGTLKPASEEEAGQPRTKESTKEEDITTIVSEQPRQLELILPISTDSPTRSVTQPDESLASGPQAVEQSTIEIFDATPISDILHGPPSSAAQADSKSGTKSVEHSQCCSLCGNADQMEEKCTRLADIAAGPTQALSRFTNDDYAMLSRTDRQRR